MYRCSPSNSLPCLAVCYCCFVMVGACTVFPPPTPKFVSTWNHESLERVCLQMWWNRNEVILDEDGSWSNDSLEAEGNLDTGTQGQTPCEDRGRDWSDMSEERRALSQSSESTRKARNRLSNTLSLRKGISEPQPLDLWEKMLPLHEATHSACYSGSKKRTQWCNWYLSYQNICQ